MKRIYVDIDGTLTDAPRNRWGNPRLDVINKIKSLSEKGYGIVLWSAGGTRYAKRFAEKYEINTIACLGKPHLIIDDNPTIRPQKRMPILSPDAFLEKEFDV